MLSSVLALRLTIGTPELVLRGEAQLKYKVHRFDIRMTKDQSRLEQFLNSLEGEIVSIVPNVTYLPATMVNFLLIVEKLP